MLGASNRGTHSQSIAPSGAISAPVWQSERNAYSAIGGNGDGAAALCGIWSASGLVRLTRPTHVPCQRPCPWTSAFAASGPQLPWA